MNATDQQFVRDLRQAMPGAWERLIDRYAPLALSVPLRLGLSRADAEEVCQATWVILHAHLRWIDNPGSLAAWIQTTVRREAEKLRRFRGQYQPLEAGRDDAHDAGHLPSEELERLERIREVREAVAMLPKPCQRLLKKLYFERGQRTYAQIARELEVATGSIGPMRARCLACLARQLGLTDASRVGLGARQRANRTG